MRERDMVYVDPMGVEVRLEEFPMPGPKLRYDKVTHAMAFQQTRAEQSHVGMRCWLIVPWKDCQPVSEEALLTCLLCIGSEAS